jgi:uncharacterized protein
MNAWPNRNETRQDEVLAFLADAQSHQLNEAPVRIDTHGAIVFLAGDDVYKVKRAISYPYMDFSTLARRKAACEAEIEVNRLNAPDIYIGVVPITQDANRLRLGGSGPVVEWAVHMRRFDENATLDNLAGKNRLSPELIDGLAQIVSDSHKRSPVHQYANIAANVEQVITQTIGELRARCGRDQGDIIAKLDDLLKRNLVGHRTALIARAAGGYVRRCHGDLHLRNIVLIDRKPVLFDAIEFDETIATIDILYDLAFLVMDLLHRGFRELACRLLNRYLWASGSARDDIAGLSLLPMYLAIRACIRAAVLGAQRELTGRAHLQADLSAYLSEALSYLNPEPAGVIAIGGLSGSGKSTISDLVAPSVGRAPGAIQLRSDIERKKRFGVAQTVRLDAAAYNDHVSDDIYSSLCELADLAIHSDRSVIVDATFLEERWRRQAAAIAQDHRAFFHGIWLTGGGALLASRLRRRGKDVSDATVSVLQSQLQENVGVLDWHRIDASQVADQVASEIRSLIRGGAD